MNLKLVIELKKAVLVAFTVWRSETGFYRQYRLYFDSAQLKINKFKIFLTFSLCASAEQPGGSSIQYPVAANVTADGVTLDASYPNSDGIGELYQRKKYLNLLS